MVEVMATTDNQLSHPKQSVAGALASGITIYLRSVAAFFVATAALVAITLIPAMIGFYLLPITARWVRAVCGAARAEAGAREIVPPYRGTDSNDRVRQTLAILADDAFWREFLWCATDWAVVLVTAFVPIAVLAYGAFGTLIEPFVGLPMHNAWGGNWYGFIHVDSLTTALLCIPLGLCLAALALVLARPLHGLHSGWVTAILADTDSAALGEQSRTISKEPVHLQ